MPKQLTKWEIWGSFERWSSERESYLKADYNNIKNCGDQMGGISYDDYIGGRWQSNSL